MKSATSLLVSVAFAAAALAQDSTIRIETPIGPVVCQPVLLTWTGGTPPYFLNILPGSQPNAQPLEQFTGLTGTTMTWTVNQPAGTSLGLTLRDSTGATGQSAPFTVNSGPDSSCLNATSSAGASSTGAGSSSAPVSSAASSTAPGSSAVSSASSLASSAPATTPSATTPASSVSRAPSSSASSASPSATGGSQNNGAENIAISGLTGLVAALVAAVIA